MKNYQKQGSCSAVSEVNEKPKPQERTVGKVVDRKWLNTYHHIKQRCENEKTPAYKYYGARGIKCLISVDELEKLWFRDKAFHMKKPSIDRIDNNGDYIFKNCRYLELKDNILRSNGLCAINARKTHCVRNHEFKKGSFWIVYGYRICKKCDKIRKLKCRRKREKGL